MQKLWIGSRGSPYPHQRRRGPLGHRARVPRVATTTLAHPGRAWTEPHWHYLCPPLPGVAAAAGVAGVAKGGPSNREAAMAPSTAISLACVGLDAREDVVDRVEVDDGLPSPAWRRGPGGGDLRR